MRRADLIIAAAPTLVPVVRKLLELEVDEILCAGVDDRIFYPEAGAEKRYEFIFVGAFTAENGVDLFVKALEKNRDEHAAACFVGRGDLEDFLQLAQHQLDIEVFHDVTHTRMRELYNSARYLVFPSRGTGFGLVVTEALYCGTPAIIYSESGAQSQIQHNFNGFVYKTNTVDKLAKVLLDAQRVNDEEYTLLSHNARQSNRDMALSEVGRRQLDLYRTLLGAS